MQQGSDASPQQAKSGPPPQQPKSGFAGDSGLAANRESQRLTILTMGHSTRPIEEFIHLLRAHGVERLVDVRTVPRSRHNPQFNKEQLSESLEAAAIHYSYMPGLGGFRHARSASPPLRNESAMGHPPDNSGWRNASFRGYADYMQTAEFAHNLEGLIDLGRQERVAIMCAEAVPWRCHRSLIADALMVRGIEVREISSASSERRHALTRFAKVDGTRIWYPPEEAEHT